jgi:hypothetical protein
LAEPKQDDDCQTDDGQIGYAIFRGYQNIVDALNSELGPKQHLVVEKTSKGLTYKTAQVSQIAVEQDGKITAATANKQNTTMSEGQENDPTTTTKP